MYTHTSWFLSLYPHILGVLYPSLGLMTARTSCVWAHHKLNGRYIEGSTRRSLEGKHDRRFASVLVAYIPSPPQLGRHPTISRLFRAKHQPTACLWAGTSSYDLWARVQFRISGFGKAAEDRDYTSALRRRLSSYNMHW